MHAGKNFSFKEVIFWTRKDLYRLFIIAAVPTCCYQLLDWKWLAVPWLPIALLGTAVAFIVGFKNNASYDRMWEARRSWGAIINASRSFGIMVKDYVTIKHAHTMEQADVKRIHQQLVKRHIAWLTALRYQLRDYRVWEAINKPHNQEYKNKWFTIDEHSVPFEEAIRPYITDEEWQHISTKSNKAAQLLALQSAQIRECYEHGLIEDFRHMELEKMLIEFYTQQGACERIKNFPYPRQYATLNLYFINIFVLLVPLGMLQEFQKLGGYLVWLTIPFTMLSTWIFTTMEKIGESTESPFEGSANDVPITAMSRTIEIDLAEMFGLPNIPESKKPINNILS